MKARRKVKGGVDRNTNAIERHAVQYLKALDRLTEFKEALSDELSQLAELQAALNDVELECTVESSKHLRHKTSMTIAGVKFSRSTQNSRSVDAESLLEAFPELRKVKGLFKVILGPFDKVTASGAFDTRTLAVSMKNEASFRYHVQKE